VLEDIENVLRHKKFMAIHSNGLRQWLAAPAVGQSLEVWQFI
jgi:hypothetical protein